MKRRDELDNWNFMNNFGSFQKMVTVGNSGRANCGEELN